MRRVARSPRVHCPEQLRLERRSDGIDDDEPFGRDAALTRVVESALGAARDGRVEIRVFQDDGRIRPTQLEDTLLDGGPGPRCDGLPGPDTPRQRDRP